MKQEYKHLEKLELTEMPDTQSQEYHKIACPSCNDTVQADNLNLQNKVAKCSSCNVVFSIEKDLEKVKSKSVVKQKVLRPEGIELFSFKDDLEITIQRTVSWLDGMGVILMPFFAFIFTLSYFVKGAVPLGIPIAFTIASAYFIFQIFKRKKNKTYVDVNKRSVAIKNRPQNFSKDKTFLSENIDQVYIKNAYESGNYYNVFMIVNSTEGQKHEKLFMLNSLAKAQFIESH